jgi:hypothetical protein
MKQPHENEQVNVSMNPNDQKNILKHVVIEYTPFNQ